QASRSGSSFEATTPGGSIQIDLNLPGRYNVANALAAIATATALALPVEAIRKGIAAVRGIAGRFELVDVGQPFDVFVDFAHTPNSLEHVLTLARDRRPTRIL